MNLITHALIMAAGRGGRMLPLTKTLPKPLAPYNGSTLIASSIRKLRQQISHIHVTVGYKGAVLSHHLIRQGVSSIFDTTGQSNSWWIYNTVMKHVNEPVIVLTCDNITDLDFELIENDYRLLGHPPCMLVPVRPIDGLAGDYIFHEGQVVTRLDRQKVSDVYCSGIQVLNPFLVNIETKDSGDFYSTWMQLIGVRKLMVSSVYPKKWFSVDTMANLATLNAEYDSVEFPRNA